MRATAAPLLSPSASRSQLVASIVVFTPGGGHRFFEELGPATRNGTPDDTEVAAIFDRHDMSLRGPPLSAD